jgi:hypothetical protein
MINSITYFYQLEKIDSSTIYTIGIRYGAYWLYRTYNKAITWDSVYLPYTYRGLSFVNNDTGWISGANGLLQNAIFRTTNGGVTLTQMTIVTGWGNLFFLKNKVNGDYIGWHYSYYGDNLFWKTTNSGVNWFQVTRPPVQYPGYFEFYNDNTGWFTWNSGISGGIFLSTNGGLNWNSQYVPSGNGITNQFYRFKLVNQDTLYGTGGYRIMSGGILHGLIWKTTNGGINWGYQEIDTSIRVSPLGALDFVNSQTGWAYGGDGIHTTNGGGPIIFTAIQNNNEIITRNYMLFQNYPNPFNQMTIIKYQLSIKALVKIRIYDINGREIETLINKKQEPGTYKVRFNAEKLPSGVYFYSLYADGKRIETKKMIYLK